MHDVDRSKSHNQQNGNGDGIHRLPRLQHEEIESDDIPQRRKAAEIAVVRLHIAPSEDVERRTQDCRAQRHRQRLGQVAAPPDEQHRQEHVGQIVDDQVERFTVDPR